MENYMCPKCGSKKVIFDNDTIKDEPEYTCNDCKTGWNIID